MKTALSPIDYYFYRKQLYTIQFVFEYARPLDTLRIEKALRIAEMQFPVLGSRIRILSGHEACLESGGTIPFRVQTKIEDVELDDLEHRFDSMIDEISNTEGEPLIRILVTKTTSRHYLGVSFSHLLGDGASFFLFLKILSDICIYQKTTLTLSTDRQALIPKTSEDLPIDTQKLFSTTGYVTPRLPSSIRSTVERVNFSNSDLGRLKSVAAKAGVRISANDIIMADLLKRFHHEFPLVGKQYLVRCPVDMRSVDSRLSTNYFGNAVKDALAFFDVVEIKEFSLAQVAQRIRQAVEGAHSQSFQVSLQTLNNLRIQKGFQIFEHLGCPGFLVSNLSKFPVSQINLGTGSPVGFYHASLNPRLAIVLPGRDGVEVYMKRPNLSSNYSRP